MKGGVSGAKRGVLEGVQRILGVLAPYGMACSQTDAAGHASLEQGTDETIQKQRRDVPRLTEQRRSMCVCVCVWTCLSKKRERELFVEVMLMRVSFLRLMDLDHDAPTASC